MRTFLKDFIMRGLVFLHFIMIVALFLVCWLIFYRSPAVQGEYFVHNRSIVAAYIMVLAAMSHVYNCYGVGQFKVQELLTNQVIANLISWGITYVLFCIMAQQLANPLAGFAAVAIQTIFTITWTWSANKIYFKLHRVKKTVAIYRNKKDLYKLEEIKSYKEKWDVVTKVRCIDLRSPHDLPFSRENNEDPERNSTEITVEFDMDEIISILQDYEAVLVSGINITLRNSIVNYCVETGKDCYFVPDIGDVLVSGAAHMVSFSAPICRMRRCAPSLELLFVKRLFDIIASILAVVITSPIMLAIAIAIKVYDGGPVFYKQVRLTKNGKEFQILKFRSMRQDAEKDGVARLSSGENDERITPVGRVLRAIRGDELAQLFNIVKGDMSIVGPRPERPEIAAQYEQELPTFSLRLQVKAGLTGYAQVYGRYNTEPEDKLKMDLMYINHIGIVEDLKLMFATVGVLFKKESTAGVKANQTTAMECEDALITMSITNKEKELR